MKTIYKDVLSRIQETNRIRKPLVFECVSDFSVKMRPSFVRRILNFFWFRPRCVWCGRPLTYPVVEIIGIPYWNHGSAAKVTVSRYGCINLSECEGYRRAVIEMQEARKDADASMVEI